MYKISTNQIDQYRELLEKKIDNIEAVIDNYFEEIKPNLIKKKFSKLET